MSGMIPPHIVEQVRSASDVVEVISGYLSLRQKGKNYFGICPFHSEKTPSFSVNPELQIFHCFGCHAGGNVFSFIMRMESVTFPEAIRQLAQRAGIVIPETDDQASQVREKEALFYAARFACDWYHQLLVEHPEARSAREYLTQRGIDKAMIQEFKLGYSLQAWDGLIKLAQAKHLSLEVLSRAGLVLPKKSGDGFYDRFRGRVMFPIFNLANQVVGFGARRIIEEDSPKYINTPETDIYQKRMILYGLAQTRQDIRSTDYAIMVEGYTDLMSMFHQGIRNVVATSGTALTQEQARLLRRYTPNVLILYDADSAGAIATVRGADILIQNGLEVKVIRLPQGHDPDSYVRANGADAVRALLSQAVPLMEFKINQLEQNGQFQNPEKKAQSIRSLLQSIALVEDRIRKMFMVKELAERFKMAEPVLWSEIQRLERRPMPQVVSKDAQSNQAPPAVLPTRLKLAEQNLLATLIQRPELIRFTMKVLACDEIRQPRIRELVEQLYERTLQGEAIAASEISRFMDDLELGKVISDALQRQDATLEVQEKMIEDCVVVIKKARISSQIEQIREQIRAAQLQNEDPAAFIQQWQNLRDQLQWIESRQFIFRDQSENA